jgi:hypothetical protein
MNQLIRFQTAGIQGAEFVREVGFHSIRFGRVNFIDYGWPIARTMPQPPYTQPRRTFLKILGAASAGAVLVGNASPVAAADASAIGPSPKRKFGRHSEMVSSLALGEATLARAESIEEATRIVATAIDLGVIFFDNAWEYSDGRAEEWMGTALQGKREKVFLNDQGLHAPQGPGGQR